MNGATAALAVLTGLVVRLAIPVLITVLAVGFLRKLDARWQSEAQIMQVKVEKPQCWKVRGCTPAQRKICPVVKSSLPCWQVFRLPNGYLREECLTCDVLLKAPLPASG